MRILNDEEIRKLLESRPWLIMEQDRIKVSIKAQHQQDLKDFIELVETKWHAYDIEGLESLKQLVDK